MKKTVLWAVASGSGGHILPALQLAKEWQSRNRQGIVIFFTSDTKLDKEILDQYIENGNSSFLQIVCLPLSPFPGKKIWKYLKFCFNFLKSIKIICKTAKIFSPSLFISTGGYFAIPVIFVALRWKSKIEIYELNVQPGRAIKWMAPYVDTIFHTFSKTKTIFEKQHFSLSDKCKQIKYPLRFLQKNQKKDKRKIIKTEKLSFLPGNKTLFFLGGSQGSVFLNRLLRNWLWENNERTHNLQIIHQTGSKEQFDWQMFYKNLGIEAIVFKYAQDIYKYYTITDYVITRAGAGTLFELEFFKKKSLIIPLKTKTTDHQIYNAYELAQRNPGIFSVVEQDEVEKDLSLLNEFIGI